MDVYHALTVVGLSVIKFNFMEFLGILLVIIGIIKLFVVSSPVTDMAILSPFITLEEITILMTFLFLDGILEIGCGLFIICT